MSPQQLEKVRTTKHRSFIIKARTNKENLKPDVVYFISVMIKPEK